MSMQAKLVNRLLPGVLVATGLFMAAPASAQFAKPEDAIKYRQSALAVMGANFGRLGAMVRGTIPFDAAKAQEAAKNVAFVAHLPWEGFVANSFGAPAKVKGDIGANMAEFNQMRDKMMAEADKLPAAAGNLDSLKAQVGATGGTCKTCHDKYRQSN